MEEINLLGKVVIKGKIKAETGLAVGGSGGKMEIGGVDKPVIKDAYGKPYIPGSSIKGKMRSLLEKKLGLASDDQRIWVKEGEISIHMCNEKDCKVCNIFGRTTREKPYTTVSGKSIEIKKEDVSPTRLIVRDAFLIENSINDEMKKNLDLEWTEVKFENVIDRVTSAANPRQIERVPAGAEFNFEMIYNVFSEKDKENLKYVFEGMELLEHDYLGSSGSRGYGKIKFKDIEVYWYSRKDYEEGNIDKKEKINKENTTPTKIVEKFNEIRNEIK
ncbi:MAG: type III-A CRISPR-associated RAMP protein Csm3 [Candidatus Thermoplasmatota archaeon]